MICAVVRRESLIVQVAGIEEGKSMSFILLAFCLLDRVTIVVVLLIALRKDLYRRC